MNVLVTMVIVVYLVALALVTSTAAISNITTMALIVVTIIVISGCCLLASCSMKCGLCLIGAQSLASRAPALSGATVEPEAADNKLMDEITPSKGL